jgi:hypothetical protein
MQPSGYTEVRLEQLPPEQTENAAPALAAPPEPPVVPLTDEAVVSPPASNQSQARQTPPPSQARLDPAPASGESIIENIRIVSQPPAQYVLAERPVQACAASPLCVAILVLAAVAVLLLAVILVLLVGFRRVPLWPWYYPVWVQRHLRYRKNRRH